MIIHIVFECVPGVFKGGITKMVYELASAQRAAGLPVEIWTVSQDRPDTTAVSNGLTIRYFARRLIAGVVMSSALVKELRAQAATISAIHTHNTYHPLNAQVGRVARALGLPCYFHPHGALRPSLLRGLSPNILKKRSYIALIERPALNQSTGVIALTDDEARDLRSLGVKAPIHVVPSGVNIPGTREKSVGTAFRTQHGIAATDIVCLFLGRIAPIKYIEDIVGAVARVPGNVALHLVIAGNQKALPQYTQKLVDLAASLGIAERLRWTGFMDDAMKPAAFAAADMFVHASYSEGMAMAILEAMAHGVPVVATRGCYMGHAAEAGALIECAQGPDALAAAIGSLMSDAATRRALGTRGRDFVAAHHSWPAIVKRLSNIYDETRLSSR